MPSVDLPALLDVLLGKLRARPDLFSVKERRTDPAGEAKVAATEKKLGVALPEPLRSFYRDVAASYGLYWSIVPGEADRLGYDDYPPSGIFELAALDSLPKSWTPEYRENVERVLRITNEGHGDGYALAYERQKKGKPVPVVSYQHDGDEEEAVCDAHRDVATWLKEWSKSGFLDREDEGGITRFLETGKTTAVERDEPLPKPSPKKKKPKSALLAHPGFARLGDTVVELTAHKQQVWGLAVLRDGERCITGSNDGAIYVSEVRTGRVLKKLKAYGMVWGLVVHPDGRHFVSFGDRGFQIWDLTTFTARPAVGDAHNTYDLALDPESNRIFTVGCYDDLKVWDFDSAKQLHSQPAEGAGSVCIDAKGRAVTFGTPFKKATTLQVYRVTETRATRTLSIEHPSLPQTRSRSLLLDRDRTHALIVEHPQHLASCALDSGEWVRAPKGGKDGVVLSGAALSADGASVLVAQYDTEGSHLETWDAKTGEVKARYSFGAVQPIFSVAPHPDGKRVLLGSGFGWSVVCELAALV